MLLINNIGTCATLDSHRDPKLGEIRDAAIVIDDDRIAWCGYEKEMPSFHINKRIDAKKCLVLPGLIDCHAHLIFAKGRADEFARRMNNESYEQIMAAGGGIMNTVQATREASDEELYRLALKRADQILAQGTTTMEAKSGYGLSLEDELRILRLIKKVNEQHPLDLHATFLGAHVVPAEYKQRSKDYVDIIVGPMLEAVAIEKLAIDCDVFCEEGAFSVADAEKILKRACNLGLGLRAHVQQLGHSGGVTLLQKLPIKSISHADFLSAEDVSIIKASGAVVEILPFASLFVRSKAKPPVELLLKADIKLALATDFNPGTAMCHDLLLAARLGITYLGFSVEQALIAITRTAACSLGRDDIGVLRQGNRADMLITNKASVNEFFYDWSNNPIRLVIKNGRLPKAYFL